MRRTLALALAVLMTLALTGTRPARAAGAAPVWEYLSIGDSVAFGLWAQEGYAARYEAHIERDTGVTVNRIALGIPGWTSADLLYALRTNVLWRLSARNAELVTWNIGGNDFLDARRTYHAGTCGGTDNQDCLRTTLAGFIANWDAIVREVLLLCDRSRTVLRTMDVYYPYVNEDKVRDSWPNDDGRNDFQVFKLYLDLANHHISASSAHHRIPYATVHRAFNGLLGNQDPSDRGYLAFDDLHPNDAGHAVIAARLRTLGYAPLR